MSKKILLSGVKPTGTAHIGNYFGAMKQFVDLQNTGDYNCHLFIADYHGLNLIQDREEMKKLTLELAIDYLAIGLDPKKSILFKQSDISAHTELAWIFNTIVSVPYLMRSHAFKSQIASALEKINDEKLKKRGITDSVTTLEKSLFAELIENEDLASKVNVGTFDYPVLMAADILLYDSDVVPVGQDQKQHVEYARDIALKFNHIFKTETFKLPTDLIMKEVAVVPGIDGRKMSKSYGNTIPLFATREEITKAVMSIVTDSGGDIPANVYNIHKLFKTEAELKPVYEAHKGKYKALKEALIEDIDAFLKPMRERRAQLVGDPSTVLQILRDGAEKAQKQASAKLLEAKKAVGVL
jgi:tryptophanyl-tRNA synthetase